MYVVILTFAACKHMHMNKSVRVIILESSSLSEYI
jgi:hypothetical protein